MAALPMQVASLDYDDGTGYVTSGKMRSRAMVKPILKKLHSHSNSDRGSLDYEGTWDDQTSPLGFPSLEYSAATMSQLSSIYGPSTNGAMQGDTTRSSRDVSFSLGTTSDSTIGRSRGKYSHARSTSGTSHASAATSTSGRNGSFVHPFQQTPRTATPPLSYANSITSLDANGVPREQQSSIIGEEDEDEGFSSGSAPRSSSTYMNPSFHRPSFSSQQRSSSLTDNALYPRQTPTPRANSGPIPRFVPGTTGSANRSRTDLRSSSVSSARDSPLSSTAPLSIASPLLTSTTPTSSSSPLSPLRNSLDMSGFRLRSRSELDAVTQQEQVREARRKFEARERAKEEKYARSQLRKQERSEGKEVPKYDRTQARLRKSSLGNTSISSTSEISPRKKSAASSARRMDSQEKLNFSSTGYDSVAANQTPSGAVDDVQFQTTKRRKSKKKTTSAWTAFVLWFRTSLLRMGRR